MPRMNAIAPPTLTAEPLWIRARAMFARAVAAIGAPAAIAAITFIGKTLRRDIVAWLCPLEHVVRKLLLAEAAELHRAELARIARAPRIERIPLRGMAHALAPASKARASQRAIAREEGQRLGATLRPARANGGGGRAPRTHAKRAHPIPKPGARNSLSRFPAIRTSSPIPARRASLTRGANTRRRKRVTHTRPPPQQINDNVEHACVSLFF